MPLPAIVGAIAPAVIGGIVGLLGGKRNNDANKAEAEKNRDFQEEMSSTAVQRSVEDYKAANLNPALAYDRSASSPGGSVAQMEDSIQKGSNNALAWLGKKNEMKQQEMNLKLTQEQIAATKAGNHKATSDALQADAQTNLLRNALNQANIVNPWIAKQSILSTERMGLENQMTALTLPGMRNSADWENFISGKGSIGIKGLGEFLKAYKGFK